MEVVGEACEVVGEACEGLAARAAEKQHLKHIIDDTVGSDVGQINEVALRRARLVLGWVTVSGFNSRCGK